MRVSPLMTRAQCDESPLWLALSYPITTSRVEALICVTRQVTADQRCVGRLTMEWDRYTQVPVIRARGK